MRAIHFLAAAVCSILVLGCSDSRDARPTGSTGSSPGAVSTPATAAEPGASTSTRTEGRGEDPVVVGVPIDVTDLVGRIVFDDYEDVYIMRPTAVTCAA